MINSKGLNSPERNNATVLRNWLGTAGLAAALGMSLFLSFGRVDWLMGWIYIGLRVGTGVVSMVVMIKKYPGLLEERFHPGGGAKAWDNLISNLTILFSLVTLIVAGLDMRFGWSPELAIVIQLIAAVVWLLGDCISKWAAVSNRFYSRVVRVQKDRGHTVVTHGPYQYVRHPGYSGGLVAGLATPIMLGSLWALVAGVMLALLLIIRTSLEDKALHHELVGYVEYAQQTRYRLVPGIW